MKNLNKRKLLSLFLFALGIRLVFWVFIVHHPERAFDPDSKGYLSLAESLLDSHTFPSILKTPVYPFFIASINSFFGKFPQAVLVFQYLLDSVTSVIVVLFFFRIFQNPKYSFIAGLLYAMNPFAVFYSNMILTETLFTFLFVIAMFLFISFLRSRKTIYLSISPILLGIAALCRPIGIYVSLLLTSCIFLGGYKFRERLISSVAFLLISYMVLIPWYMKNYEPSLQNAPRLAAWEFH